MQYDDLELLATNVQVVKEKGQKRIAFQVQVPRSPAGELTSGIPANYDARVMREWLEGWEDRPLEWRHVLQLGEWLGSVIFPPPVRDLLVRSLDLAESRQKGLRLRLLLEGELHDVPWEYALLNRAGGEATISDLLALLPNVSLVRHQAATLPAWEVAATLPARLLVALASPSSLPALKLDQERALIETALLKNRRIQATFVANATPDTLFAGGPQAHLFHFAGHGDFQNGEGVIALDDGYGDAALLTAGELAVQLRQMGVRVAVLGACRSGRRDGVNVWGSVAAALLKAGLGAVVAMQYTVQDTSAIAFAGEFYRALVAGLPIDEAVTAGRLAIARADVRDWGVPVLYLRAPDGVIFPEQAADTTLQAAREQLRVTAQQRIGELRGQAVAVDIGEMGQGVVAAKQVIDTVAEGGVAIGVKIKKLGGGAVQAGQKVDTVGKGGSVTGVKIGKL